MKRVAIAVITGPENLVLMGRRRDSGLWTFPGGHIDDGESAHEGMAREVKEETGLTVTSCKLIRVDPSQDGQNMIYTFECQTKGEIDTSKDPDLECKSWTYEDPFDRAQELHVPAHKNFAFKWWVERT